MRQRTSLVHPSTSKLAPDQQAQGVYEYTPPTVRAYLRNEPLSAEDMREVADYYTSKGLPLPEVGEPALAGESGIHFGEAHTLASPPANIQQLPRKVVRKAASEEKPPHKPLEEIVAVAIRCYTPLQKEALFNKLAAELGYSVE